ncbi:MAG: toxic anion resistance protein [bacterium]|nr:toxic anion resistance protein [bacterium]
MNEFEKTMPTLTLTPDLTSEKAEEPIKAAAEVKEAAPAVQLTAEEQQMVDAFAQQIDVKNSVQIMNYGAGTQQKIAGFADKALENVRTNDTGEIGEMLASLVMELKGFDAEEERKGFLGFFKKASDKVQLMKVRYDRAEVNVDKISQALEQHQVQLLKDMSTLDQMYEINLNYLKELTMYIIAGKKKIEEIRAGELKSLRTKADQTGLSEDAQAANDLQAQLDRFEKKISDLELTRMVSIQTAPQIRLIQNNDAMMAEKIQSTIVNTIPLWKSQMILALGISHSQQALKAQQAVSDMTNDLLKKNASMLKQATTETAREAQRGIVDIETLKETNQSLIETLDEVMNIQADSREKRRLAEEELRKMEDAVKAKLLEMR